MRKNSIENKIVDKKKEIEQISNCLSTAESNLYEALREYGLFSREVQYGAFDRYKFYHNGVPDNYLYCQKKLVEYYRDELEIKNRELKKLYDRFYNRCRKRSWYELDLYPETDEEIELIIIKNGTIHGTKL